jgi:hypothetical protein
MLPRLILALPLLGSTLAMAAEQPKLFESVRSAGRGGTFVAAYDSSDAARQNPAALAEFNKSFQLRILDLDVFLGQNVLGLINDMSSVMSSNDPLTGLRKFDEKFGERQSFRGQVAPVALRFGHFEISLFGVVSSFLELRDRPIPKIGWEADLYYGAQMSYGRMIGKNWSWGVTVRPMSRIFMGDEVSFSDITDMITPEDKGFEDLTDQQKGSGVGVDVGGMWMPSATFRLGAVIQNIGDMGFGKGDDTPVPMKQQLMIGMIKRFKLGKWNYDILVDVQDLENRAGVNLLRKIHLGNELGLPVFTTDNDFGILAGINEGYFTGGAYADLWLGRLELSNYAVELGESPGQRMDRRWGFAWRIAMTF